MSEIYDPYCPSLRPRFDRLDYAVHDLGSGYRLRIPDVSEKERWQTPMQGSMQVYAPDGYGMIESRLVKKKLHVSSSAVHTEHQRSGIATRMTERLFAAAIQHGALTSGGVARNFRPLKMYEKMVGAENIIIEDTDSPDASLEGVLAYLPDQTYVSDGPYCSYSIRLLDLKAEHIVEIPDTTGQVA